MPVDKFGRSSRDHYRTDSEVSRLKTYLNNTFLRTDGSKPAIGSLNMDTNKISNVVDPLNNQDAATKHYVDAQKNIALQHIDLNFLRMDGTKSASGTLNMDTNKISNVRDPLNNQDVATKHYVDTTFVNMFIKMQKDHFQKHEKLLLLISNMQKTLASIPRQ